MQYSVGKPGRIVAARLFEGEDIYKSIESIAQQENINAASVLITGGMRKGDVVVGPESENPIVPKYMHFEGPGEVLGVGTLYNTDEGPKLHLHAAIGKNGKNLVCCPRKAATTFLILEVTIIEIAEITASRKLDKDSGMNLLDIE